MTARLGISASSGAVSCVLRNGAVATSARSDRRTSGSQLPAIVDRLFREAGLAPPALSAILLDVGPGSYTGLRVAVTFARCALGFRPIEVSTATSIELMALAAWRGGILAAGDRVRVVLDARRSRFHTGTIELGQPLRVIERPRAVDADAVLASLDDGESILAQAHLHRLLRTAARARGCRMADVPDYGAEQLFDPALAPRPATASELEPLYLMGSYAED